MGLVLLGFLSLVSAYAVYAIGDSAVKDYALEIEREDRRIDTELREFEDDNEALYQQDLEETDDGILARLRANSDRLQAEAQALEDLEPDDELHCTREGEACPESCTL